MFSCCCPLFWFGQPIWVASFIARDTCTTGARHRTLEEQYSSLTRSNFWINLGRCVRYALVGLVPPF